MITSRHRAAAAILATAALLPGLSVSAEATPAAVTGATTTAATNGRVISMNSGMFLSPSGNIICRVDRRDVTCEIIKRTYRLPAQRGCDGVVGQSIGLGRRPYMFCQSDTMGGLTGRTLPYGWTMRSASFTCTSSTTGMTCKNRGNGHGFMLSKSKYKLF